MFWKKLGGWYGTPLLLFKGQWEEKEPLPSDLKYEGSDVTYVIRGPIPKRKTVLKTLLRVVLEIEFLYLFLQYVCPTGDSGSTAAVTTCFNTFWSISEHIFQSITTLCLWAGVGQGVTPTLRPFHQRTILCQVVSPKLKIHLTLEEHAIVPLSSLLTVCSVPNRTVEP